MNGTNKYLLLLSPNISKKVINYLKRNQVRFKQFEFNPVLDLLDVPFHQRKNGMRVWRDCDNFIEGILWEDHKFKPKTQEEKIHGMNVKGGYSNRGWTKFRCSAYVTEDNPKGIMERTSWITCNHCPYYSPRTLEGRKHILEVMRTQYQERIRDLDQNINQLEEELEKQRGQTE